MDEETATRAYLEAMVEAGWKLHEGVPFDGDDGKRTMRWVPIDVDCLVSKLLARVTTYSIDRYDAERNHYSSMHCCGRPMRDSPPWRHSRCRSDRARSPACASASPR